MGKPKPKGTQILSEENCFRLHPSYKLCSQKSFYNRIIDTDGGMYTDVSDDLFSLLLKCDGTKHYFFSNELEVIDSFLKAGIVIKSVEPILPSQISISNTVLPREISLAVLYITGKCNLNCKHCFFSDHRNDPCMSLREYSRLADELYKLGVYEVVITGGEPLLHPEVLGICKIFKKRMFIIRLLSNGILLTPSMVNKLINAGVSMIDVSLDGASPETHDTFRGTSCFNRIVENLEFVRNMRNEGRLARFGISTSLTKNNIYECEDIYQLMKDHICPDTWIIERPYKCGNYKTCADELSVNLEETHKYLHNLLKRIFREKPSYPYRIHLDKYFHWLNPSKYANVDYLKIYCSGNSTGFACGNHLNHLYILPDGSVNWCIHTDIVGKGGGGIWDNSLEQLWNLMEPIKANLQLNHMECRNCELLRLCGGGCRIIPLSEGKGIQTCDEECKFLIQKSVSDGMYNGLLRNSGPYSKIK